MEYVEDTDTTCQEDLIGSYWMGIVIACNATNWREKGRVCCHLFKVDLIDDFIVHK